MVARLPFFNFPISCIDNGFIVKAQLVVVACFLETEEREKKRERVGGRAGREKERIKRGNKEGQATHERIRFI